MNKLIIVGAGGFGREVLQWALQSNDYGKKWEIAGFLDDNLNKLDGFNCSYPILDKIINWQPKSNECFVMAIGSPKIKEKITASLTEKGAVFENVIHSSVVLASTVQLGQGVVLCPGVVISDKAVIGNHVSVNINTCIGHDVSIGDYVTINSLCDMTGDVVIGKNVFVSSSVSVIPGCKIGEEAYLCAGSVVMNNVPKKTRVLGVPAKKFEIRIPA